MNYAGKKAGEYAYIFESAKALAEYLAVKSEIGIKARKAYLDKDTEALTEIANVIYPKIIKKLDAFIDAFECQWFKECKPFGFDVQHVRLGGTKQRLIYSQKIIKKYLSGEVDSIPELEEPVLPYKKDDKNICANEFANIVSPNSLSV